MRTIGFGQMLLNQTVPCCFKLSIRNLATKTMEIVNDRVTKIKALHLIINYTINTEQSVTSVAMIEGFEIQDALCKIKEIRNRNEFNYYLL